MNRVLQLSSVLLLISFLQTANGQVAIGTGATAPTPNPNAVLLLVGNGTNQGLIIPSVTSLSGFGSAGMVVYNSSSNTVHFHNGTAWNQVGAGGSGTQGIQISGNTVSLTATPNTGFGLSSPTPTATGQLLVWNGTGWESTPAPTTNGQTLSWNQTTGKWTIGAGATVATLSGDVSGASNSTTIANTAGNNIATAINNAATTNRILESRITPSGTNNQVLTTVGGVAQWANATGGVLPSLSANQLLSNNGSNTGITVGGDLGLSVAGTTGTFTIANNAITTAKINNGAVTIAKIGTAGVPDANKILSTDASGVPQWTVAAGGGDMLKSTYDPTNINGSAFNLGLHTGQISTAQITDANVTNIKLATGIDAAKITTGTLPGTVLPANVLLNSSTAGGELSGTLAALSINNNAITTTKINNGAVTVAKIGTAGVPDANKILSTDASGVPQWTVAAGSGDMLKSTYDPTNINGSAFNLANHTGQISTTQVADASITDIKLSTGIDATKITTGILPVAQIPSLDASKISSGTLPVALGGTGSTTLSGLAFGNGTSPLTAIATGINGQILTVSGGNPTWQNAPAPSGSAGGDLLGSTYPNPVIAAGAINSTKLATNAVATINISNLAVTDTKINDVAPAKITAGGATSGQVLKFNGTNWIPQADNVGGGGAPTLNPGQVIVGDGTSNSAATLGQDATLNSTNGNITVQGLRGRIIDPAVPSTNSVYQYDGTKWTPVVLAGGGTVSNIATGTGLTGGPITATGTISIAPGGVGTTELAANSVTSAKIPAGAITTSQLLDGTVADADISASAAIAVTKLATGTNGQVLTVNAGVPSWQTNAALTNPMIAPNDLIVGGAAGAATRLTAPGNNQLLSSNGSGAVTWVPQTNFIASGSQAANLVLASPNGSAGAPTFRSIVNGDITSVDASKITTGTVPIARGGTNSIATPTNGAVAYGTGTAFAFTGAGTSGQLLQSNGAAAPTWVNAPAAGWSLTGNAGTNPATNFIGTNDAQPLRFATGVGGVERMRIDATGNLGIGAPTPLAKLDVAGGNWDLSSSEGDIRIGDASTYRLKMGIATGGGGAGDAYIATQGGSNRLFLGTANSFANTQTLTLAGGNVGVNNISPTYPLDIKTPNGVSAYGLNHSDGTITMSTYVGNGGVTGGSIGTQSDHPFFIYTANGGARMTILGTNGGTNTGGVGIGKTNPVYPLDVNGNIVNSNPTSGYIGLTGDLPGYAAGTYPTLKTSYSYMYFSSAGLYSAYLGGAPDAVFGLNNSSTTPTVFLHSNGVSYLNGGNVGIGTATPAGKLHVENTDWNITPVVFNSTSTSAGSTLRFINPAVGNRTYDIIGSTGTGASMGAGAFGIYDNTSFAYRFVINSAGNVGIGTFSPTQKLHVIGNILASGTITPSDSRLKENISELNYGLKEILRLRPVSYNWKTDPKGKKVLGLIAQETVKITPEVIELPQSEKDFYSMNYVQLIPVLIKAAQELNQKNEWLEKENSLLKAEVAAFKQKQDREMASLKKQLEAINSRLGLEAKKD